MERRTEIIAVVGPSGSGKTTAVEHASRVLGIPQVVSYTTRPMREGEKNGREHWFVTEEEMPEREKMLAYTFFGGHHYWTEKRQIVGTCLYVIDEKGLQTLKEYPTKTIYIDRTNNDVDEERRRRDADRETLPMSSYDAVIHNDGSLEELLEQFTKTCRRLL